MRRQSPCLWDFGLQSEVIMQCQWIMCMPTCIHDFEQQTNIYTSNITHFPYNTPAAIFWNPSCERFWICGVVSLFLGIETGGMLVENLRWKEWNSKYNSCFQMFLQRTESNKLLEIWVELGIFGPMYTMPLALIVARISKRAAAYVILMKALLSAIWRGHVGSMAAPSLKKLWPAWKQVQIRGGNKPIGAYWKSRSKRAHFGLSHADNKRCTTLKYHVIAYPLKLPMECQAGY